MKHPNHKPLLVGLSSALNTDPCLKTSYKEPVNDKCKTIQIGKPTVVSIYKPITRNSYETHQQTTTTEQLLQCPDLGHAACLNI